MSKVTDLEIKKAVLELNNVVTGHSQGSVMRGLEVTAAAFAAVMDIYANPNEVNPEGMCDDPQAFRQHFSDLILSFPPVKAVKEKKGKAS